MQKNGQNVNALFYIDILCYAYCKYKHREIERVGKPFLNEINTFIQQGWIQLIENDGKYIYKVIKVINSLLLLFFNLSRGREINASWIYQALLLRVMAAEKTALL